MPTMANIAVLNNAGGSVTYTAATSSAGDKVPAIWRQNAASEVVGLRPSFAVATRDNAKRNGRILEGQFRFPIFTTDSTTGQKILLATVPLNVTGTLPTNVDAVQVKDAFVQFGNLLVSSLMRSVVEDMYAPV